MTPAQLGALISEHNAMNDPDAAKHRARTRKQYDDPADLIALANMKLGG